MLKVSKMTKVNKMSELQSKIQHCISICFRTASSYSCLSKWPLWRDRQDFCLQVTRALVNEQEACHTGAVLLRLSERINLCLSLPPLRGFPQSVECLRGLSAPASPPQASTYIGSVPQDVM